MPKVKKVKKLTEDKEERQYRVFEREVRECFDRIPQGSLVSSRVHALIEKLNKA